MTADRAAETPQQEQERREKDRARHAGARAAETPQQTRSRSELQRTRQAAVRTAQWTFLEGEAFRYDPTKVYDSHPQLCIGRMIKHCLHCNALKWPGEAPGMCCSNGKVKLPALKTPPEPLESLTSGRLAESKHFLENIRRYNSCFQMTSFGVSKEVIQPGYMPTFKVQGQVYHRVGSLLASSDEEPKFLQIYFMGDERKQAERRYNTNPGTRRSIIIKLQEMLHQHNSYVRLFKTAIERMPTDEHKVVIRADKTPAGEHARRFNESLVDEVAVVMVGSEFSTRDIVLEKKNSQLKTVCETNRAYDALQYPLIFWEGEDGYHFTNKQVDPTTGETMLHKKVSAMAFYAYRIMVRNAEVNHILRCRQLFHQFIVDMYAKIEAERLLFVRTHQQELRVDDYIHLKDAIANDGKADNIGQLVILPSTFTGSPRHMHEYTQDAMTYVRNYGRPDLFLTFTCNPKWEEIKRELMDDQTHSDRHDVLARVFKQKLTVLMNIITKNTCVWSTQMLDVFN
ncbi:unnamed protein product [Adineta ricciae]|uniref:Helitron helicase-like domain-containing protein n=1 Tax=Adineta ricciae TaxID=249248 RepID=A0A815LTY7_ADIRI|nr:unnamed protein product [Adineta ricciae]